MSMFRAMQNPDTPNLPFAQRPKRNSVFKPVSPNITVPSEETEFIHVSGHPNREDLKDMYQWVKPKCVIPVHGEHRHMIEHINFAKEMQVPYPVGVQNGDIVLLHPGDKPKVIDKAPVGKMYVDGNISVGEESQSIKDRKNLSYNGFKLAFGGTTHPALGLGIFPFGPKTPVACESSI